MFIQSPSYSHDLSLAVSVEHLQAAFNDRPTLESSKAVTPTHWHNFAQILS